ncbi:MAG: FAD-dependent oxidoreductase, partial [Planctomycetota bacterium]
MMMDRYGHDVVTILTHGHDESFSDRALELAEADRMPIHRDPIVGVSGDPKNGGLEGYELEGGTRVETTRTVVALGIIAYNELLTELGGATDESGKAIVNEKYESSVPGLFVAGDLVASKKMQIYTAWDMAVDAAD